MENLEITFRDVSPSPAVEEAVSRRARALAQIYPRITACRVAISVEGGRHRHGALYRVQIDLHVPEGEIVVGRLPAEERAREDVNVALREAFDAARRRLAEHAQRHRGRRELHDVAAARRRLLERQVG